VEESVETPKIISMFFILFLLIPLVHFTFLYQNYAKFPSRGSGGCIAIIYDKSTFVCDISFNIEGPTKPIYGFQTIYEIKIYFWNFNPNVTEVILELLESMIYYWDPSLGSEYEAVHIRGLAIMADYYILYLDNYTIKESNWLNTTFKWRPLPIIPHIKAMWQTTNLLGELLYVLLPIRYAYTQRNIKLQCYIVYTDDTIKKLNTQILLPSRGIMYIALIDWSPFIFYQLPTLILLLSWNIYKIYKTQTTPKRKLVRKHNYTLNVYI